MDENAARGPDVESSSQLQTAELERDWAARRLELSRGLDVSIQQVIAGVLNAAGETRQGVETEAKLILDRLRHERSRLIEDVREYRRQREGLAAEIADTRRRAEEDAGRIRRAAENERTQMLAGAETRRTELMAEIQRLEEQLADVSSGIQSLLQEQIGRVRGELGGSTTRPRPSGRGGEATPGASRGAADPAAVAQAGMTSVGTAGGATGRSGADAVPRTSTPPPGRTNAEIPTTAETPTAAAAESARDDARSRAASVATRGGAALGASETPNRSRRVDVEGAASQDDPADAGARAGDAQGVSTTDAPGAVADVSAPVPMSPPPPPPTTATGYTPSGAPTEPSTAALGHVELSVTNTPSFARALEFQRGVQRTEGVRQVQALQFENGTLVLAVEHDPGLDIAAAVGALANLELQLVRRTPDRIEFSFPDA